MHMFLYLIFALLVLSNKIALISSEDEILLDQITVENRPEIQAIPLKYGDFEYNNFQPSESKFDEVTNDKNKNFELSEEDDKNNEKFDQKIEIESEKSSPSESEELSVLKIPTPTIAPFLSFNETGAIESPLLIYFNDSLKNEQNENNNGDRDDYATNYDDNLEEDIPEVGENEIFERNENGNLSINAEGTGVHNSYTYPNHHHNIHNNHVNYNSHHQNVPHYTPVINYNNNGHHGTSYHGFNSRTPLKPSFVHHEPHSTYNSHDALRTKDHDKNHHHYHQSHNSHHNSASHYGRAPTHGSTVYNSHGHAHGTNYPNFQPYHYDSHHTPECADKNLYKHNLTFCLEDHYYPTETIEWAIRESGQYARKLLSDVSYQSADNLIDGLTRAEEEGYTYEHYFGAKHEQHHLLDKFKPPYQGYSYSQEYYKKGGYICPSNIYYARPRRAMNTYGKWKVIVNLEHPLTSKSTHGHHHSHHHHHEKYTQTLRLEQCIYHNSPCSYIDSHVHSRCVQKHNFVRLVAWTKAEGLHVDVFKLPIACSCHISQPISIHKEIHHQHKDQHLSPHPHLQALFGLHKGKKQILTSLLG